MEEIKKKKKGRLHRIAKASIEAEVNNKKMWLNIRIYIYTHKQNQNSPTKTKYNRLIQWTKETKNYIYQNKTN